MKKYYASVHWTVEDLIEFAEQNDYPIPIPVHARILLATIETNPVETMIASGREVIAVAVHQAGFA